MRRLLFLSLAGLVLSACPRQSATVNTDVEEWRLVLHAKKTALKKDDPATREQYAARLLKFVQDHPDHARAREVYTELEIDLARDLTARGDYDRALQYLRDVQSREPQNRRLQAQLAETLDLESVDPTEVAAVKPGMTFDAVRATLGAPPPGWTRKNGVRYESWFYRNSAGGTAAVHFDAGRVIAVDYDARRKGGN